ncbi:MAG TPA: hypothetical protein VH475_23145 [Tepidisphaeraceae bacterium]|jgi:hypothetical protein
MSDDQTPSESPADSNGTPPAGTDSQAETISLEAARELRREAKQLRARVKELEAAAQAAADEKGTDLERLQRERDQAVTERDSLSQKWRFAVGQSALAEAARQAGAISPRAVWRLVDAESLEIDESGTISNLDDVLATVKTTYPEQFRGPGSADGGAGTNADGAGKVDANAALRQLSGRSG